MSPHFYPPTHRRAHSPTADPSAKTFAQSPPATYSTAFSFYCPFRSTPAQSRCHLPASLPLPLSGVASSTSPECGSRGWCFGWFRLGWTGYDGDGEAASGAHHRWGCAGERGLLCSIKRYQDAELKGVREGQFIIGNGVFFHVFTFFYSFIFNFCKKRSILFFLFSFLRRRAICVYKKVMGYLHG